MYKINYTKKSLQDISKIKGAGLEKKAKLLIAVIKKNPFSNLPSYEKLIGSLSGLYSRRINSKHRLVYQVFEETKEIKIISLWSHYEF